MAKGNSSLQNKKARSSKPYDASNSFVRKVASQVTNLLPQSDWLTRWFSASDSQQNIASDGEDDDVVEIPQPPPNKRARIALNTPLPAENFRVATEELRDRRPTFTSPSPIRNAYSDAIPGPSGLSTSARFSSSATLQSTMVSENVESKLNGDGGSDSSESTSGCSSLVPQASKQTSGETLAARRRCIDEKLSLTNHLQRPKSLFPNRGRSPRVVPPPNRRRPSFDLSYFNSSPTVERDKLLAKDLSPFYAGRTMFGGASAYRRPREAVINDAELNLSKRGTQVRSFSQGRDSSSCSDTNVSVTARRILEALEEFSSPVQDAKRMPLSVPTYRPPLGSKRKRVDNGTSPSLASTSYLGTPQRSNLPSQSQTVPVVADLMKVHSKKLQDTMESARRIASVGSEPYSIRQNEDQRSARHQNKILKSSGIDFEMASEVKLPEVPLPITTMPKFDIVVPPATSVVSSASSNSFKFSPPIVVTSAIREIQAQGTFTFSEPVDKSVIKTEITQNFTATCPSVLEVKDSLRKKEPRTVAHKSKEQNNSGVFEIKPASELKTGSVMDYFKSQKKEESGGDSGVSVGFGDAFKPAAGSWECEACMLRNVPSSPSCVACETPREKKTSALASSSNTWKCTTCFVMNNNSATACVACTVVKPSSEPVKKPMESGGSTWKCAACQAVNAASSTVCKDCWCNRPSQTLSDTLWTCSSCKNRNNVSEDKCTICKKSKVSTSPSMKAPGSNLKFNVPIPPEASSFKFGIDNSGLQQASGATLGGFKFGESAGKSTSSVAFSFGVPSTTASQGSDKPKDTAPVTTTSSTSVSTKLNTSFSFGTNQNQFSEISNSTAGSVKMVSALHGADGVGSSGKNLTRKRKSDSAELAIKDVISAQMRKAESSEADKSEENKQNLSMGFSKSGIPMFNSTDASKMATVSSSSLGTTVPVSTKTTSSSGFSFVSSSTSSDKPISTTAPTFLFGGNSPKAEQPSAGKKPASLFSAPAITAAAVPSFNSTVTSSSGFGSTTNVPTTTSTTFMFGSGSSKSSFGTATATTTTNSLSSKVSFAAPVTSNPSFGVPDTTTPAFGSPGAKPNSSSSSVATTASVMLGSNSSPKPVFGGTTATTVSNFGLLSTTTATTGSFTSTSASPFAGTTSTTASAFGSTSSTPSFGLAPAAKVPGFGTTPSTVPSIFGPTTTTVTPFGSTSTTTASVFGATTTPSIFGSTVTTSTASAFSSAVTTAASLFGSTPATTASVFGTISTAPAFGSATTTLTSSFNNTPVTTPSFSSTATPSFGVPPSSTPSFGNVSTTPAPSFGAPVTTASGFAAPSPKPVGFGNTTPAPSFGNPPTSAAAFGTPSTPAFGSTPGNVNFGTAVFGTPVVTTSSVGFGTPTATPSFGTPKAEPTFGTPATAPAFGSGFGTTSAPTFGGFSSDAAKSPASGAFVFKGNTAPSIFGSAQSTSNNSEGTPSKVPSFGFGTANTGTSNATPAGSAQGFGAFNFSAGSNAAPPAFGSNAGGTSASSGFGSAATPAFGSSSGGFGSGAFNFNAGNANPQPFGFTGNQPNQNATPSFGQVQQSQPPPPTFNPNVRPTFDFTRGETPQFTAQSTAPMRRVKKAVRRVR